jgi:hypothetical protein
MSGVTTDITALEIPMSLLAVFDRPSDDSGAGGGVSMGWRC